MSDEHAPGGPDIRITGGDPDSSELAAVTAVLTAALDQLAQEHRRRRGAAEDGWAASGRGMREPLRRGTWGAWL